MSDAITHSMTDSDKKDYAPSVITQEEIDLIKKTDVPVPEKPTPWMEGNDFACKENRNDPAWKKRLAEDSTETYNIKKEVISKLRSQDGVRPPGVEPEEFRTAKKTTHKEHLIAYLAAAGMSNTEIAKQTDIAPQTISVYLRSDRMQQMIKEKAYEMFGKGAAERFMRILPKAIETAESVMIDATQKGSVRAEVAFKFMDRAMGKPKQQVEHSVSNVRTLIEKLDELSIKGVEPQKTIATTASSVDNIIDVEPESLPKEESKQDPDPVVKDEIDSWIDKNL